MNGMKTIQKLIICCGILLVGVSFSTAQTVSRIEVSAELNASGMKQEPYQFDVALDEPILRKLNWDLSRKVVSAKKARRKRISNAIIFPDTSDGGGRLLAVVKYVKSYGGDGVPKEKWEDRIVFTYIYENQIQNDAIVVEGVKISFGKT